MTARVIITIFYHRTCATADFLYTLTYAMANFAHGVGQMVFVNV